MRALSMCIKELQIVWLFALLRLTSGSYCAIIKRQNAPLVLYHGTYRCPGSMIQLKQFILFQYKNVPEFCSYVPMTAVHKTRR